MRCVTSLLILLAIVVITALLDGAGLFVYLGAYPIFTVCSLLLGVTAISLSLLCLVRRRDRARDDLGKYCLIVLYAGLLAAFTYFLPRLPSSRFKEFYLLSRELQQCKSIDDPFFRSATAGYIIDRYPDDPSTLWIRINDPGDSTNIIVHLGEDDKSIMEVEFDPD